MVSGLSPFTAESSIFLIICKDILELQIELRSVLLSNSFSFFFSKPPGDESRQRRHSVALSENERLQMDKQAKMPHAKS